MRLLMCLALPLFLAAETADWKDLVTEKPETVFNGKIGGWFLADSVEVDPANPKRLVGKPGKGVFINGKNGRESDLTTKDKHGDIELEMEFYLPKGSNSGVKFHSVYEIQLCDSFGKKGELTGSECGGVYPRANLLPIYKHIDKGIAPRVNACTAPGTWQKLTAIFLAPRFDADGKKTASARLVKVTLNGQVIHEDVELKTPTGHNWTKKEVEKAPLLIQGDHGPVAFRHVRLRPYTPPK